MARLFPQLTDLELENLSSRAEAKFYKGCRVQLDDDYLVLHGKEWILREADEPASEGETDFIMFHKNSGILIVEVKGGGISRSSADGAWSSIDRHGHRNKIKDPFSQARRQKHWLVDILNGDPRWARAGLKQVTVAYAVMLPDVADVGALVDSERPAAITGGARQLAELKTWIRGAISYWTGRVPKAPLGEVGMAIASDIFCRAIEVRPALSVALQEEEDVRITLTQQQNRALLLLGARSRARIAGGAGTGKTLLAMEKARQLSAAGKATLLLCYNRPLADTMKKAAADCPGLKVMTFHQMCDWGINAARSTSAVDLYSIQEKKNPSGNQYDDWLPDALASASEYIDSRFDAIVVDEGQDFREKYWFAVELFLRDSRHSTFFVFYDENQAIYEGTSDCGIVDAPFVLTLNCRNTRFIHEAAYRYYRGEHVFAPGIIGEAVRLLTGDDLEQQSRLIVEAVRGLIDNQAVRQSQIEILVAGHPKASYYDALRRGSGKLQMEFESHVRDPRAINVDTVGRFKGLEADIVFLWGPEVLARNERTEALYVGLSRAKARLYLVGKRDVASILKDDTHSNAEGR